jgi:hypothetical protein
MDFHSNPFLENMMSFMQTSFFPVFPHTEPATLILYRIRSYKRRMKKKPGKMSNYSGPRKQPERYVQCPKIPENFPGMYEKVYKKLC